MCLTFTPIFTQTRKERKAAQFAVIRISEKALTDIGPVNAFSLMSTKF